MAATETLPGRIRHVYWDYSALPPGTVPHKVLLSVTGIITALPPGTVPHAVLLSVAGIITALPPGTVPHAVLLSVTVQRDGKRGELQTGCVRRDRKSGEVQTGLCTSRQEEW